MYCEDDLLPLSGIQRLAFCERQAALVHIEGLWVENRFTAEGNLLHQRTHEAGTESRADLRMARGLALRSLTLGLSGQGDVVEFHRSDEPLSGSDPPPSARLPGVDGWWRPFPVEYKRGKPKPGHCDEAQLCAQAMCLEEMFRVRISGGALFYASSRRRVDIPFDEALRETTRALAQRFHDLVEAGVTPPPPADGRCKDCSQRDSCVPASAAAADSASAWLRLQLAAVVAGEEEP